MAFDLSDYRPNVAIEVAMFSLAMKEKNPGSFTDGAVARSMLGVAASIALSHVGPITEDDVGFVHEALVSTLMSEVNRIKNNNARRN